MIEGGLATICIKVMLQPKIVQIVESQKMHGIFKGERSAKFFELPQLYVAETGYTEDDGRPILGLYAGEKIEKGRYKKQSST